MSQQITVNEAGEAVPGESPAPAAPLPRPGSWFSRIRRRVGLPRALGIASILDATILPSPIEMLMIAGMLAKRDRVWPIAIYVTLGCIAGSTLSYLAGALLYDAVAVPLVERMGGAEHLRAALDQFHQNDWLAIFVITMTPIPLPIAGLAAGASGMNPVFAVGLIALIRGVRYFGIAWAIEAFGPAIAPFFARFAGPWFTVLTLAIGAAAIVILFLL